MDRKTFLGLTGLALCALWLGLAISSIRRGGAWDYLAGVALAFALKNAVYAVIWLVSLG